MGASDFIEGHENGVVFQQTSGYPSLLKNWLRLEYVSINIGNAVIFMHKPDHNHLRGQCPQTHEVTEEYCYKMWWNNTVVFLGAFWQHCFHSRQGHIRLWSY